ncbi:hypothetical protein Moror_4843 [Moniliophthora roreri MCA 2997]|uniref:Uncharacterized protein n=1 Tax=Moniliophthora roreri (strain MCA 2997) TaxID=1381753 RepID=V2W9Q8_MONRO|nr:hypothetical protein Moror_4843 [Moniliophthora roreri MCA 2997]
MSSPISATEDDTLLPATNVDSILKEYSEEALPELVKQTLFMATEDGVWIEGSFADIAAQCKIETGLDGFFYPTYKGKPLECTFPITPHSTFAFNNGPDGSTVLEKWKEHDAILLIGIGIQHPGPNAKYPEYIKLARYNDIKWSVQVFPRHFHNPRKMAEWHLSGKPITAEAHQLAKDAHDANSQHVRTGTLSICGPIFTILSHDGYGTSMFMMGHDDVFKEGNLPLDEGRGILVRDYSGSRPSDTPMSFHECHLLEKNVIFAMTMVPRAFIKSGAKENPRPVSWDFRLVNIQILGKRAPISFTSPKKKVKKRKA